MRSKGGVLGLKQSALFGAGRLVRRPTSIRSACFGRVRLCFAVHDRRRSPHDRQRGGHRYQAQSRGSGPQVRSRPTRSVLLDLVRTRPRPRRATATTDETRPRPRTCTAARAGRAAIDPAGGTTAAGAGNAGGRTRCETRRDGRWRLAERRIMVMIFLKNTKLKGFFNPNEGCLLIKSLCEVL